MEADHPYIWDVLDVDGNRITTLVGYDGEQVFAEASHLYGARLHEVVNTGKRKPPGKCCDKCKDHPCG